MAKTLGGEISPHTTEHVDVETMTGPGCEDRKESYFSTSFSKKGPGDYATLVVELKNELTYSLVRIYKPG